MGTPRHPPKLPGPFESWSVREKTAASPTACVPFSACILAKNTQLFFTLRLPPPLFPTTTQEGAGPPGWGVNASHTHTPPRPAGKTGGKPPAPRLSRVAKPQMTETIVNSPTYASLHSRSLNRRPKVTSRRLRPPAGEQDGPGRRRPARSPQSPAGARAAAAAAGRCWPRPRLVLTPAPLHLTAGRRRRRGEAGNSPPRGSGPGSPHTQDAGGGGASERGPSPLTAQGMGLGEMFPLERKS